MVIVFYCYVGRSGIAASEDLAVARIAEGAHVAPHPGWLGRVEGHEQVAPEGHGPSEGLEGQLEWLVPHNVELYMHENLGNSIKNGIYIEVIHHLPFLGWFHKECWSYSGLGIRVQGPWSGRKWPGPSPDCPGRLGNEPQQKGVASVMLCPSSFYSQITVRTESKTVGPFYI